MVYVMDDITKKSEQAANFLKALANKHRLMILCQLADGEKSVTDIMEATGISQTSMSQHLSKLKREGLVVFKRDHRTLFYSINNGAISGIMEILYKEFCDKSNKEE